jgi:hypothetical protein
MPSSVENSRRCTCTWGSSPSSLAVATRMMEEHHEILLQTTLLSSPNLLYRPIHPQFVRLSSAVLAISITAFYKATPSRTRRHESFLRPRFT